MARLFGDKAPTCSTSQTMDVPDNKAPYGPCPICHRIFASEDNLQRHFITAHGGRNESIDKLIPCPICQKGFTSEGKLKQHLNIAHGGEKPYVCQECNKRFSLAGNLKKHQRVHTGEQPFKCQQCGRGFTLAGNLKKHMLTHTGNKPHECQLCGKTFSLAGNLKQHMKTHVGDKPHKCNFCDKSFTLDGNLTKHVERMHMCETWINDESDDCDEDNSHASNQDLHENMKQKACNQKDMKNKQDNDDNKEISMVVNKVILPSLSFEEAYVDNG